MYTLTTARSGASIGSAALFLIVAACAGSGNTTRADTLATSRAPAATGQAIAPAPPMAPAPVPQAVTDIGNHGEDLYDAVHASDWSKAQAIVDSLDGSVNALPAGDARIQPQRTTLSAVLDTLHREVAAHHRYAALEAANQVTYRAAKMSEPFEPTTPAAVALLDFYGREVEIWAAQKNLPKLQETASAMRATWNTVRPAVESHGGNAAARDMERDVANVEAARTPAEFARLATPVLDLVDVLEKVFTK